MDRDRNSRSDMALPAPSTACGSAEATPAAAGGRLSATLSPAAPRGRRARNSDRLSVCANLWLGSGHSYLQ